RLRQIKSSVAPCKPIRWGFTGEYIMSNETPYSKPAGNTLYSKVWSTTGSEFCIVSRNAGMKRKQRLLKV
ncbi:MAG: hypothetical protein KAR19_09785, partial [Bacteroidales bacterium]|nr:hypothetical protein [Bacteroidales bacterium]